MYANKYTFLRMYLRDCSEIILKKKKKKKINSDLRKSKKKLNNVCTNTTNENFVTFYGYNPSKDKVKRRFEKRKKN